MALEPFDFSCAVVLPNGTSAYIQQTDIQRGARDERTVFVAVRPDSEETPFMGALHLSSTCLRNLEACPGDSRAERSRWVTEALRTWVKRHGLAPDFTLDLTVDVSRDRGCQVGIAAH